MSEYLLGSRTYQILKWVGLVLLPATAALVGAIGPAWGLPNADGIVLTLNAVGTFIGTLVGVSQLSAMGRPDGGGE